MKLLMVRGADVDAAWPMIAGHLRTMIEANADGDFSLGDIRHRVRNEQWDLWLVLDEDAGEILGVGASYVYHNEGDLKVAQVPFFTGRDLKRWAHLFADFETWARNNGCQRIRIMARRGWGRILDGFEQTHVRLDKELN